MLDLIGFEAANVDVFGLVWFDKSQIVHVPLVRTYSIVYGPMTDSCSLLDK